MTNTTQTYGLLLRHHRSHGYDDVVAEIICRRTEDGIEQSSPRNPSGTSYNTPKFYQGLHLEGLSLRGFYSSYGECEFILDRPAYRDVYKVDANTAEAMLRTLKLIGKRIDADDAREPADIFMSFAQALRLSFVVECADELTASTYDAHRWHWMSLGEGRNRYRRMIAEGHQQAAA